MNLKLKLKIKVPCPFLRNPAAKVRYISSLSAICFKGIDSSSFSPSTAFVKDFPFIKMIWKKNSKNKDRKLIYNVQIMTVVPLHIGEGGMETTGFLHPAVIFQFPYCCS